jgi:putative NIF3 family GTP cyclohydrolase 1 type 2
MSDELRAREVLEHFRKVGTWVDWGNTCDEFLHGDAEAEVAGIAVAWIPTNEAIRRAAEMGCNLFITHEPAFYPGYEHTPTGQELVRTKKELLDRHGMTVMRCHDTWDRMPEFGIPDSWASYLGFDTEPRPVESYYKTCLVDGLTVEETARRVLDRVQELGQDTVLVFGDRSRRVRRLAVGTGAITYLPHMYDLNPDAILATDDGINFYAGGLWAIDLDVPLLIVNHATAEKPGMQAMARYLREVFAGVSAEYIDVGYPYSSVRGET